MYTATAVPKKGITVQACKHACMCTHTHTHTQARMHAGIAQACTLHACKQMYIHPANTLTSTSTPHIHTKIHKFMVLAETSTFGIFDGRNVHGRNVLAEMSMAETSVAEISYIPISCGWTAWFVSDLVGNPPVRVSRDGPHILSPAFEKFESHILL